VRFFMELSRGPVRWGRALAVLQTPRRCPTSSQTIPAGSWSLRHDRAGGGVWIGMKLLKVCSGSDRDGAGRRAERAAWLLVK